MLLKIRLLDLKNIEFLLSQKVNTVQSKGNLEKHYGKLKRGIDGLQYQKELR
jgi:hypothetical protein